MTTLRNSFDGGTDTGAITTGNSGGASGDALGYVSGSPVYSSAHAHSGTLAAKFPGNTSTTIAFELSSTNFWVRAYVWLTAFDASSLIRLWDAVDAGGNFLGAVNTNSNGSLELNSNFVTVNLAGPVALNQWVRVEAYWSTTGGAELRLYNVADGALTSSVTNATNIASACATQDFRRSGPTTDGWMDDIAVSTDGWIGPTFDGPFPKPVISAAAVVRGSRW